VLHVVSDPPDSRNIFDIALVDDERDINFVVVGTLARGSINVYRLTWQGRVIPVFASWKQIGVDEAAPQYNLIGLTFVSAGLSHYAMSPFPFESEKERADAELVSVECLLAFGRTVDGLVAPSGFYGYPTKDGRVTLQSFGY
jgi:hypothetical protein